MNERGFTLVEVLVYVALLGFFAHLFFAYAAQMHGWRSTEGAASSYRANALLAFAVLVRDIRCSSCDEQQWKVIAPTECVWYCPRKRKDIGWAVENSALVRITGVYNNGWQSRRRETALTSVENVRFEVVRRDGQVVAVRCCVAWARGNHRRMLEQWIAIRERRA